MTDDKSAGNFSFTTELIEQGYLGYWRRRQDTAASATPVEINPANWYNAIYDVLTGVIDERALRLQTELSIDTSVERIITVARLLTCGCCVQTYLKLRNITLSELPDRHNSAIIRRPRVCDQLAIPTGIAFAIQQLGLVNVADSRTEVIYAPCYPNGGHTAGVPTANAEYWNPDLYAEAVEYARKLGMTFAMVDRKKKDGTAWWLFRHSFEEDVFELSCSIPEPNFTKSMVCTHAMFLNGNALDPSRALFNLQPLGDLSFGIMMRNPHRGIHLTCYEAISAGAQEVVSNV